MDMKIARKNIFFFDWHDSKIHKGLEKRKFQILMNQSINKNEKTWNKVDGGQITPIHPPEDSIKLTSHINAGPYKVNSLAKNSYQIQPSHISAIIEQNNYTNFQLKTIDNQTERIENTICKALTNAYQDNKRRKHIIEIEPLILKPKPLSKTSNLEKKMYQLLSKSNFLTLKEKLKLYPFRI